MRILELRIGDILHLDLAGPEIDQTAIVAQGILPFCLSNLSGSFAGSLRRDIA
jgi:hypothetical protein